MMFMSKSKKGDVVKMHYKGTLSDGTVFDSSQGRDPLEFTLGAGMVIPGFDQGAMDMEVGQKKILNIPAKEAYGDRRDDLIVKAPRDTFPKDMTPEVGQQLGLPQPNGHVIPVTVVEVADDEITLDANHELAGKDLTFEIELVGFGEARDDDA